MRACVDEGLLQSYLDGELSSERMESVTCHLASCLTCSAAARELESENNLLAAALAPEFEANVPTERLRQRIDAAVAGLQLAASTRSQSRDIRGWLRSLSALSSFESPRALAYASVVVVLLFATVFLVIQRRQSTLSPIENLARKGAVKQPDSLASVTPTPENSVPPLDATAPSNPRPTGKKDRLVKSRPVPGNPQVAEVKLLPGERSYLKAIAALDSTLKNDRPMKPALQAEYERNLALVDRALAAARNAAKKNPNDADTAEFVFAAYQSKVDLLNTVADARLYNRER